MVKTKEQNREEEQGLAALQRDVEEDAAHMVHPRRATWVHQNLAAFVLAEGKPYLPASLSREERRIVLEAADISRAEFGAFEFKHCFANAQQALLSDPTGQLVYVEGYCRSAMGFTFHHGWLSVRGKVVDFTGPPLTPHDLSGEPTAVLGEFTDRAYFGVPFLRAYVRRRIMAAQVWHALLDDWTHDWPLLKTTEEGWRRAR